MSEQLEYIEVQFSPAEGVTTREAAELTGYTKHNITRAARSGTLQAIKRGNMLFFRRNDILLHAQKMKDLGKSKHIPNQYKETRLE